MKKVVFHMILLAAMLLLIFVLLVYSLITQTSWLVIPLMALSLELAAISECDYFYIPEEIKLLEYYIL